jgi:hypothetical protein
VTIFGDEANANGTARFLATGTDLTPILRSPELQFWGSKNFSYRTRLRVPTYGAGTIFTFGLSGAGTNGQAYFTATSGTHTNWQAVLEDASIVDTGIAVDNTFRTFEVTRVGDAYTWRIDDVVKRSATSSNTPSGNFNVVVDRTSGADSEMRVDYVRARIIE